MSVGPKYRPPVNGYGPNKMRQHSFETFVITAPLEAANDILKSMYPEYDDGGSQESGTHAAHKQSNDR